MRQNTKFAVKPAQLNIEDLVTIDLTDPEISMALCNRWLQNAHDDSTDDSFRRLIADVMEDLSNLGSMEGDLRALVLGALGSVQSAMEIQDRT